ncbi:C40 family peptidase [Mucilaginibacter pocheonensis]|uniref:Cell wall-associated NlpC family hydrolase n=1 Tax=Mucilaginibacter pocheonensis TaxID=398050 RepID=A0ABU1TGB5_9SPHI|nr:C40 family peptidase [Mucilaginibacter pocheonensis]MDR6944469.1 cell wall-associated NlpC family hydrolase [Mucilaginibacter pocheonensis]
MIKSLTLVIFIVLAASLFCTAHVRKVELTHKIVSAKTYLYPDSISADSILHFAQSLIGTRYRSRSSSPIFGFDCSGFVSYVFKKFNFNVPRSSRDFIDVGKKIKLEDARPGDIILFTGTKKYTHKIGHVGIVYCTGSDEFKFIHSTSGKEHGVTITSMDKTYKRRFVQVIRLLI